MIWVSDNQQLVSLKSDRQNNQIISRPEPPPRQHRALKEKELHSLLGRKSGLQLLCVVNVTLNAYSQHLVQLKTQTSIFFCDHRVELTAVQVHIWDLL